MQREAAVAADSELAGDAVRLLQSLIRFNTANPPGNEREAQEFLLAEFIDAGMECELLGQTPARPNLVARLRGDGAGPTVAFLAHVDTVPADPSEWTRDPWGGDLAGGYLWGRGALDMKDQVSAEAAACARLAREGWRPRGELLLVITADEEAGADLGAQWLCAEHPDKVRADLVINEGGGRRIEFGGRSLYPVSVGEKGVFRFRLRTRGAAGHASLPGVGENALLKLAPLLSRLASQPPPEETEEARAMLSRLLGPEAVDGKPLSAGLDRVREADPMLAAYLVEPMCGVTLNPTKARASEKDNIVPSRAEVLVDCRVPPEMGEEAVRMRIESVLGRNGYEIDFVEPVVGNRSPIDTALWSALAAWVEEADPGAELLPVVMPGFSDSHWWRKAFGSTVYGFCPQNAMSLTEAVPLVHGADERVAVADVELMSRFFCELPQRLLV
jgi:acetylornithine deacetylase/succinyl-diaminopimelate desuccinylase-like protein